MNEKKLYTVILLVSANCNLACKYCYEGHKRAEQMEITTARRICESEIAHSRNTRGVLEIVFLGGEPLLNFKLIKQVSEWIWEQYGVTDDIKLSLRTNGTLLNADMRTWFSNNRDKIELGLSLDGFSQEQQFNRGVSAEKIDVEYFVNNWPSKPVKVVLFKDSVKFLSKTVFDFLQRGIKFELALGEGFYWDRSAAIELEKELRSVVEKIAEQKLNISIDTLVNINPSSFYAPAPIRYVESCLITSGIKCFDTNGTVYRCHMFTPLVVGKEKSAQILNTKFPDTFPIPEHCIGCPICFCCKNCIGMNVKITGRYDDWAGPSTTCLAMKALSRVRAYHEVLNWQNQKLSDVKDTEVEMLRNCVRLLEEVNL